ncbi:calcium-dependent protein kinase [Ophiostoma piceae UAMH 11346]|uniref:non-specific serine/threonine protein kinase n=1 Tax=Ophiostoma piceae (strain UAMH 11346) TaxID=1262450 RepID=S3C1V3_OPHP1|nr:calcium-dependent protein kinase [Ophiostoma piceae UAMH 11346]
MSLVPYQPQEGREIVLRHRNAIVVHDPTSQRLEIRGINLNECPTCHRPLRSASPERPHYGDDSGHGSHGSHSRHEGFVDPNYFRLLRAGGFSRLSSLAGSSGGTGGGGVTGGIGGRNAAGARPTTRATGNPFRRLFQPLVSGGDEGEPNPNESPRPATPSDGHDPDDRAPSPSFSDAEFVSSTPYVESDTNSINNSSPINKQAFSPNYFSTFFIEERELGRGGKGVVLLVRHEIDGCVLGHFACKRVPVGDDHAWLEKVLVEVELLAKLSHPNLVSYRHVWLENKKLNRFGPPVACAFILQQYCNGGDLHRFILGEQPKEATKEELKARMRRRSRGAGSITDQRPIDLRASITSTNDSSSSSSASPSPAVGADTYSPPSAGPGIGSGPHRRLAFDEIYSLFKDITSGLAYLHAANYIHRDLKPSNCLLHRGEGRNGSSITCLISDFGEVQPENVVRKSTGTTGTISYCAPEVLRIDPTTGLYGNFTTKSDVFSLGMILYFMCFGRLPYHSANSANEDLEDVDELRVEISAWRGFQYERRVRSDLPSQLYELLTQMLSVNANERPSANEVLLAMRTTTDSIGGNSGVFGGLSRSGSVSGGSGTGPSAPLSPSTKPSATLNVPPIISGRRIQNLDSPEPSGTPIPDPSKRGSPISHSADLDASAIDDSDDLPTASSPLLRARNALNKGRTTTPQRLSTSTSLTLSRSHGSHSRSPERSQPMARHGGGSSRGSRGRQGPALGNEAGHEGSGDLSPVRRSHHAHAEEDTSTDALAPLLGASIPTAGTTGADDPYYSTPMATPTFLLMPPPTTFWGEVRHQALLAQYHATVFVSRHAEPVSFFARSVLFLVKMATLSRPCWPYMFQTVVGAVLVTMAGLDLGIPRRREPVLYRRHQRRQQIQIDWTWDWRASTIFLVLHFAILSLASRYDVLCARSSSSSVQWEEW